MNYTCPLCGSALTKNHFHKVIKLRDRQEKSHRSDLDKLRKQAAIATTEAAAAKRREQAARAKAKAEVQSAKKEAAQAERRKSAIRDKRLIARINKLEEEKAMLQKHTSPQEIGLADESVLVRVLRKEFPDDRVEHAGKGGDVLHYVALDEEAPGCIVYECKHTDRIAADHVTQTALAKKTRNADYGILVTTGTRKRFAGLDQESGVFIIAQSAVLTLAHICRGSLLAMSKARLDAAAKVQAAKRLMDYVTSPVFKTPLEEAISQTERAHRNLVREIKQHVGAWKERHELYQTIHYDVAHIRENIARVVDGRKPLSLEKPRFEPLAISYIK